MKILLLSTVCTALTFSATQVIALAQNFPGDSADGYIVHPYSAVAFDAAQYSIVPVLSLRAEGSTFLLPRPANPKDILRADPEDVHRLVMSGEYAFPKAVVQIQGTPFGIVVDYSGNIDMAYDTGRTGKIAYSLSDIALNGTEAARQRGQFLMSARTSTIGIDLQTKTGLAQSVNGVPAQLYSEFDFLESNPGLLDRNRVTLRHLFARVGGTELSVLGGQQWSNFGDQGARPYSLVGDYAPAGAIFRQNVLQVRFTKAIRTNTNVVFAIETPINTDFVLVNTTDVRLQRTPNLVAKLIYEPDAGINFIQSGVLFRTLGVEDVGFNEQIEGAWGLSLLGSRRVLDGDRIQFGVVGGEGIGDYIYGLQQQLAAGGPRGTQLDALRNFGAYIGYIRRWSDQWQTHTAYGYANAETTASMPATAISKTQNLWTNLIYRPNSNTAFGLEYGYAVREVRDGTFGENHRIQFTFAIGSSRSAIGAVGRGDRRPTLSRL